MKSVRFVGVPHAPKLVIPEAGATADGSNVTPWAPGEIRSVDDAVAERLVKDYAEAGSLKQPAFVVVTDAPKAAGSAATK
jgi:hypothetical protein